MLFGLLRALWLAVTVVCRLGWFTFGHIAGGALILIRGLVGGGAFLLVRSGALLLVLCLVALLALGLVLGAALLLVGRLVFSLVLSGALILIAGVTLLQGDWSIKGSLLCYDWLIPACRWCRKWGSMPSVPRIYTWAESGRRLPLLQGG